MFHLFDVKTGKELTNLPKVKDFYETTSLQKGVDLLKLFYDRRDLRMRFIDYSECLRKNCVIVSHSLKKSWKQMFSGQTEYYKLVHKKELKKLSSSFTLLNGCPDRVKIKFDIIANRIMIQGRGVNWKSKKYRGNWIFLEDYEEVEEKNDEKL